MLLTFRTHGKFYRFDVVTAMFALITGAVLIGVATTVVDIAAVNLYTWDARRRLKLSATSRVIRAKRVERVKPNAVMPADSHSARRGHSHARSPPLTARHACDRVR